MEVPMANGRSHGRTSASIVVQNAPLNGEIESRAPNDARRSSGTGTPIAHPQPRSPPSSRAPGSMAG